MTVHRSVSVLLARTLIGMGVLVLLLSGRATAAVPTPELSPAPPGTHGFPFLAAGRDLAKSGYVEEEFFISGTAQAFVNRKPLNSHGKWAVKPNPGVEAPYTTRLIVRRPANAARFNGTVVVEWLNVSGGFDVEPAWTHAQDELVPSRLRNVRKGYAYVGVSAQFNGVTAMKEWDAERYGALAHPGDSFSYDIYSQAAQATRAPAGDVKPLGPLTGRVRELLASGASQSGARMLTYYNAVHRLANLFDGFLIHVIGYGSPISESSGGTSPQAPPPAGVPPTPDIAVPHPARVRDDLKEPVLFLNTETEINFLGAARGVHLQPDSESFRMWELAGAAHLDQTYFAQQNEDLAKSGLNFAFDCGPPPLNNGQQRYAVRAAIHALRLWTRFGLAPRIAPRLSVDIPSTPGPAVIQRDPMTGIAVGGVRLPVVAAPLETNTGERPAAAIAAVPSCALFGATDPWNRDVDPWDGTELDPSGTPEPDLEALYPSHLDYVRAVGRAARDLMARGYLRPADAIEILHQAAGAQIPE
jgi:hypothetical protein